MKRILLASLLVLSWALPAPAAVKVLEAVVTTGLSDHTPVDSVQTYSAGVKRLYCYTHVVGASEEAFITHVWYRGKTEMARMQLPVRAPDWRTWSTKAFLPQWTGKWRVEILNPEGKLLSSVSFTLN